MHRKLQFRSIIFFLVFSSLLGVYSCDKSSKSETSEQDSVDLSLDSLDLALEKIVSHGKIAGFGVALVDQNGIIYAKGYGKAEINNKKPYTKETIQNIASISKTFLGIALLKAQEMGKLKLDDPINKYLPFEIVNPNFNEVPITIRHLSTHTSSIVDTEVYNEKSYVLKELTKDSLQIEDLDENFNKPDQAVTMEEFLRRYFSTQGEWYSEKSFLEVAPGERFEYSNVGAALAAYVLERATDMNYVDFSQKYILDPLEMKSSGWNFESVDMTQHTLLYQVTLKPIPFYRLITYPDGGLITSVEDLGKYLSELIKGYSGEGTLLSKASYKELFAPQLKDSQFEERDADSPYNDEYDMGVFMGLSGTGNIGHTGGDPGVSSIMFFNSESKIGQILIINTDLDQESYKDFIKIWETTESFRALLIE